MSGQAKVRVFTRDATGLVREISFWGAFGLVGGNMSAITGWTVLQWFGYAVPGGELGIAMVVGTLFALLPALIYSMISSAMPRSGGDYVFNSRVLTPGIGFMASFFLGFYYMTAIGWNVSAATVPSITAFLAAYGRIYNNSTLLGWSAALANVNYNVLLSLVIIAILTMVSLFRVSRLYRVILVMLGFAYLSLILQFVAMLSMGADFAAALNEFSGVPNLYQTVIESASKAGVPGWSLGATLGPALLFSWLVLGGYQFPAYISGEIKRPRRNLPLAIIVGLVINGLLYAACYESYYRVFGYTFMQATSYPNVNPSALPLTVPFFVSILAKDNVVMLFLIQIGFILGAFVLPLCLYPFATRLIFAWSFDRVLPERFAQVSDRLKTPVNATILASVIFGVFFLFIWNYTTFAAYYVNMIMGYVIATLITMVAAMVFPWRKVDVFKASGPFAGRKVSGFPLITIIGALAFVLFAYILYSSVTNPTVGGPISYASIGFMLGVFVVGLIIYYISLYYHRSKAIDIGLAFKELPPE